MTGRTFLGLPVHGDIVTGRDGRVRQRPLEEFTPLVQVVLDDPLTVEFGWRQYTPYFNDGEPCVFGAHGTWLRTAADGTSDGDDDDDGDDGTVSIDCHPTLGNRRWNEQARQFDSVERSPEKKALYVKAVALDHAVVGGAFDDVLLDAFGDHAYITVRRDGITVGSCAHD